MYKWREPAPNTFEFIIDGFSFYLSPAISGGTVENGIVDICCMMNGEPFTYTPVENGRFVPFNLHYYTEPLVYFDCSGPFLNLPFNTQESYSTLYFSMIRTTARALLKRYFGQGPQKAALCFIWIAKGLIHKDVIKYIAQLVWDSRSDMHVWGPC